ncbi:hypothetical protein L0934_11430 [Paracidovorax citrulli]
MNPQILVVHPGTSIASLADYVARARATPGRYDAPIFFPLQRRGPRCRGHLDPPADRACRASRWKAAFPTCSG